MFYFSSASRTLFCYTVLIIRYLSVTVYMIYDNIISINTIANIADVSASSVHVLLIKIQDPEGNRALYWKQNTWRLFL